jgi:hypothetical protein
MNKQIKKNEIPNPPTYLLDPYWFQSLKGSDSTIRLYDDQDDISQALLKSIKQEYKSFGFTTWDESQVGDTGFRDKMSENLKKPKFFKNGKDAYAYISENYPDIKHFYNCLKNCD